MCGIAGLFTSPGFNPAIGEYTLRALSEPLRRRGPDHIASWSNSSAGIGLVHTRLSIVDLSPAGHQPMHSSCNRYTLIFNGEIYNHLELRNYLNTVTPSSTWVGNSDTETLLACISYLGLNTTLDRLDGMYAFALWDAHDQLLYLVRDKFGEKPLYYTLLKGLNGSPTLLFSSDISSFYSHPNYNRDLDPEALQHYIRLGYYPAPYTVHQHTLKLPPASLLAVALDDLRDSVSPHSLRPVQYWSASDEALYSSKNPFQGSFREAVAGVNHLLHKSIRRRSRCDVRYGTFLSAGVDSSLLTSILQSQKTSPVKTFSLGFDQSTHDESYQSEQIARYLGTDHTSFRVSLDDAIKTIPELPNIYTEPFADSSQIPTYIVSSLASSSIKVSITGDGGDEFFGGYNRYTTLPAIWSILRLFPGLFRLLTSTALTTFPPQVWDNLARPLSSISLIPTLPYGELVHKFSKLLSSSSFSDLHYKTLSLNPDVSCFLDSQSPIPAPVLNVVSTSSLLQSMQLFDIIDYLPGDILAKVDRASMACSLETRAPFLDLELFKFAFSLSDSYKVKGSTGKTILRSLLREYLPPELIKTTKTGFSVPLASWLRQDLKDWAYDSLSFFYDSPSLAPFNANAIRRLIDDHSSGSVNNHYQLWPLLVFARWYSNFENYTIDHSLI